MFVWTWWISDIHFLLNYSRALHSELPPEQQCNNMTIAWLLAKPASSDGGAADVQIFMHKTWTFLAVISLQINNACIILPSLQKHSALAGTASKEPASTEHRLLPNKDFPIIRVLSSHLVATCGYYTSFMSQRGWWIDSVLFTSNLRVTRKKERTVYKEGVQKVCLIIYICIY